MVIIVPVYYTHNSAFVARNDVNDANVQAPCCTDENYVMRVKRINRALALSLSLSRSLARSLDRVFRVRIRPRVPWIKSNQIIAQ